MRTALTLIVLTLLSALPLRAVTPPPIERVEIRGKSLWVNGEPFFLVGIGHAAHWNFALPEVGAKGFNAVVTHGRMEDPESYRLDIDDAFANGMYSLASLTNGNWRDLEKVEQVILACRDAPGLLAWELQDEPNMRLAEPADLPHMERPYTIPPEQFKPVYDLIKRLDPGHPVWLNLAYGSVKDHQDYRDVADIHSDDVYPLPDYPLTHVAVNSDSVVQGAAGKPGWMYVQISPQSPTPLDGKDRAPTMEEVRCMTYMAVTHGISGIIHFSFHSGAWSVNERAPAYWAQFADLTAELRTLTPYLTAAESPDKLQAEIIEGSAAPSNFGYTALHLSLRKTANSYFLIAVNGFDAPVKGRFTFPVPEGGLAPRAAVRFENRLVEVTDGVMEDAFAPYAVHLYELPFPVVNGTKRMPLDWPQWQRRVRR